MACPWWMRCVLVLLVPAAIGAVSRGAAVAQSETGQLAITLNQTVFHPGEVVELTVEVDYSGPAFSADVYMGALLPGGLAAFLTSLSPPLGTLVSLAGDPRSFPPLLADFVIQEGSDTTVLASLSFPFANGLPRGTHDFFAVLTQAGTLQDGRIDAGDLIVTLTKSLTFADLGTGLKTAQIEVTPSSPTSSDAISVRLSGQWPDACQPMSPQLRITGTEIRIDTFGRPPTALCAAVLTPWGLTVPVSPLPAGVYRVVVINTSQGQFLELGRTELEIE